MKNVEDRQASVRRTYGDIVYWLSIAAALICTIAPVLTIAYPDRNFLDPRALFSAIWAGKPPQEIWSAASNPPGPHFWLRALTNGDSLIQFGLELGCCSAGIALLATTIACVRRRPRSWGWAAASLIIAVFVALAALGIYQQAA